MLRMLGERAVEMQKDLYVCFIDYVKAFDRVQHGPLLEMLESLDLDGQDVELMKNLYWGQQAAVRVNSISEYVEIYGKRNSHLFRFLDIQNNYS